MSERAKVTSAQSETFEGRTGFLELGHSINFLSKTQGQKATQEKILEFFLLDTFKTTL